MLLATKAWADPAFFVDRFCWGRDYQTREVFDARLWPHQRELYRLLRDPAATQLIVLKARGLGVTWAMCWFILWEAITQQPYEALLMSRRQEESNALLDRINFARCRLPAWLPISKPAYGGDNKTSLTLAGPDGLESKVHALPADADAPRSYHPRRIFVDEWPVAFPGKLGIMPGVKGAVEAGGTLVGVGTARGLGNEFHEVWANAEDMGFRKAFWPWTARPGALERGRPKGPAWLISQEYPETAAEAFVQGGESLYFDQGVLAALTPTGPASVEENGRLLVWEEGDDGPYIIGADCAAGSAGGDFSCAVVWSASGRQAAEWRGRLPEAEFAAVLDRMARRWPGTLAVERNDMGSAVCLRLEQLEPPGLWRAEDRRVGWRTNAQTRPQMLSEFEAAFREGSATVLSAELLDEMRIFGFQQSGKLEAPGGYHDDRVMAAAIGWAVRAQGRWWSDEAALAQLAGMTVEEYQAHKAKRGWS